MDQDSLPRDEQSSPTMFDDVEIKNSEEETHSVQVRVFPVIPTFLGPWASLLYPWIPMQWCCPIIEMWNKRATQRNSENHKSTLLWGRFYYSITPIIEGISSGQLIHLPLLTLPSRPLCIEYIVYIPFPLIFLCSPFPSPSSTFPFLSPSQQFVVVVVTHLLCQSSALIVLCTSTAVSDMVKHRRQ